MANEADTCRKHVVPKLQAAGWDNEPYSITEQRTITDGRIVPRGQGFLRKPPKRVDYLLRYRRDTPLAVVEAKAAYKTAFDGVQQARQYAEFLGLMPVPGFQELTLPVLREFADGHECTTREVRDRVATALQLTAQLLTRVLQASPSAWITTSGKPYIAIRGGFIISVP